MLTMPDAAIVSIEQDPGLVARYRERLEVGQTRTVGPTYGDEGELVDLGFGTGRPREVIFDSLTVAPNDLLAAQMLVDWCAMHGARAIAIAHETVAGTAWGGHAIQHLVHSRLRVFRDATGRQVEIGKDRSGPDGRVIPWRLPTDKPAPRKYVSVEGAPGRYRLVEHPARKAEWAGPFDEAESGTIELPPPPLAVAARRSRLYPGGWALPGDVDERQAFAEGRGFTFFSPPPIPAEGPE